MSDNWEKVEKIFHAALELPPAERTKFLQNECAGDTELSAEVESLLENHENPAEFLDENVFELGLGTMHESEQVDLSGSTIGLYEIKEKIGAGGMGNVYRAFDTRLNRIVALKFLTESLKNDNSAKRRLVREAQAAAALEHPNICAVYGFEQTDEHHFIVMQHIEGKMLGEYFKDRRVGVTEFKSLARQILEGVAFAHSHDVIHRDLKPGNIMLNPDGQIKILDFGLAKVLKDKVLGGENGDEASRYSQHGLIIGTVAYMSPEQLRGERLDFRSDIFSVGIVLRELMAGQNPFSRQSQAETIAAILAEQTPVSKEIAPEFPRSLREIVEKCLHKDREKRFQSAAEILVELDNEKNDNPRRLNSKFGRSFFLAVSLIVAVLFSLIVFLVFYHAYYTKRTIAVLPFSFDNPLIGEEYLSDGLTQSLIEKLSNLSDVKIINKFAVAGFNSKTDTPETAGKRLSADAVFVGSIVKRDNALFLKTKLVRTSDGFVIDDSEIPVDTANLIELQENLAARIIDKIKSNLTDEDRVKLTRKDTENEEAKRQYYLGRYFLSRRAGDDMKNAVMSFQTAKELDPYYAKAWAGLADAYLMQSLPGVKGSITPKEAVDLARVAAKKALEIDNDSCEAFNSLGAINLKYDWNWAEAETNFRAAISRNPEFIPARTGLIGVLNLLGRFDESLEQTRKIKEIDPVSTTGDLETAKIYYMKHDFQQMEKIINEVLAQNPGNDRISYMQIYLFLNTGRFNEAISFLEKLYKSDKPADKIFAAAPLGFAYAKTGRRSEALKVIEELDLLAKTQYVAPQEQSLVYLGLGNLVQAFETLGKSCNERFPAFPFWIIDPVTDEIKSDVRFKRIKECANL